MNFAAQKFARVVIGLEQHRQLQPDLTRAPASPVWRRLRSPCLGQCERAPAALVVAAGDPPQRTVVAPVTRVADIVAAMSAPAASGVHESLAELRRLVPHAGEPDETAAAGRRGLFHEPRGVSRLGRLSGFDPGPSAGPRRRHRRCLGREPDGVRRRRIPHRQEVGGRRRRTLAAALRRVQRRRIRARQLQGPRADGRRSVRHRRGDHRLRVSRRAATGFSTSAASIPTPRRASPRRRRQRAQPGCSATTWPVPATPSISRSAAARARTSAAKRPPSSTRSKAGAGAASKPPFPSQPAVRQTHGRQQRGDAGQRPRILTRAAAGRRPARRRPPARASSACPGTWRAGLYELPFGNARRRAAAGWRRRGRPAAAGDPARRRGRDVRRAGVARTCV